MNLQRLTILVEILDAGNLSKAARKLKMTRANISYHLNLLEKEVGVQLVRRSTLSVEPTEAGERLYEHGRNILNELMTARESITTLGQSLQGRVGISVPSGFGQMFMMQWLIEFKERYPDIHLDVMFENRIDNMIREGIDIAIRIMSDPPENLIARNLGTIRYIACASADYVAQHGLPTELQALAEVPIITSSVVGKRLRLRAYKNDQMEEVYLSPSVSSEHFPFIREAMLAGLGVGIMPDYVVLDELKSGKVLTTLDDYTLSIFGRQMFMLYMPNRHQTRAIRACIDYLLEKARQMNNHLPTPCEITPKDR
ncbi:MAG TPA: LysR substrate-binding domain-containing protein [Paenalcaligenes sp.]|nr:LysR substrate-binding domain-containing protein [Paenalcaligenes sp.]